MASVSKLSYQRLTYDYGGLFDQEAEETAFRKKRKSSRFRKFTVRRRPKLRIPGLRRFLKKRIRFFSKLKVHGKGLLRDWRMVKFIYMIFLVEIIFLCKSTSLLLSVSAVDKELWCRRATLPEKLLLTNLYPS